MKYLLDTMIVSEPAKPRPNRGVVSWLEAEPTSEMAVSVLTFGEIRRGVARMAAGQRRKTLEQWLRRELPAQFHDRVLSVDTEVALMWGELTAEGERVGRPLPTLDGLLLATAHVHALSIVTRNVGDFADRGVAIINPYS